MIISRLLRDSLNDSFRFSSRESYYGDWSYTGKSILVKKIGESYFIPSLASNRAPLINDSTSDIVIPLGTPLTRTIKTVDSIINNLFNSSYTSYSISFLHIDTTKGPKYYGSKGLILTEDFKPLIICGHQAYRHNNMFIYEAPVCIISPRVFTNEDIISKAIVKKIIPYYSTAEILGNLDIVGQRCNNSRVNIIITPDIDSFIRVPCSPIHGDATEEIYSLLEENLAELQK